MHLSGASRTIQLRQDMLTFKSSRHYTFYISGPNRIVLNATGVLALGGLKASQCYDFPVTEMLYLKGSQSRFGS